MPRGLFRVPEVPRHWGGTPTGRTGRRPRSGPFTRVGASGRRGGPVRGRGRAPAQAGNTPPVIGAARSPRRWRGGGFVL